MKQIKHHTIKTPGSWSSLLTPEKMVQKANTLGGIISLNSEIFVVESRPSEKGRNTIGKIDGDQFDEILPAEANVRTRVHEYGGNCLATDNKESFFYTEFSDQNIYRVKPGQKPTAITKCEKLRFANFTFDQKRNALFAVMEDHRKSDLDPENSIVRIDIDTGNITMVVSGHDFYAYPKLNSDGNKLAFIAWNHPQMPWDGTELFLANLNESGDVVESEKISGSADESVVQPEWHNDSLYFLSDKSGWWNLHSYKNGTISNLLPMQAEFAKPMWGIGTSYYQIISETRIFVTWCTQAQWKAGIFNPVDGNLKKLELPYSSFSSVHADENQIYFIGSSFTSLPEAVRLNPETGAYSTLYRAAELPISKDFLSIPESIEFSVGNSEKAHAFYYPPHNPEYALTEGEKPPLLVISHGGPTSCATATIDLSIQFWTSRGFAVVDVNYSGSSGFGREFRDRLKGNWGLVDVRDCEKAALYLIEKGLADPQKVAIRGGSAGGFTTLCALTFTDSFNAGASHFGLSDLEMLAKETHKFESRYMDKLIGEYPQHKDIYQSRSPINSAEKLSCPIIFLQGLEDKVVPPNQAERMFEILKEKGIATSYVTYEGEGHGFRKSENIKHALEAELYFYSRVFDLECELEQAPIEIHNI